MFVRSADKLFLIYSWEFRLDCACLYFRDHCPSVRVYPPLIETHFARISFNRSLPYPIRLSRPLDVK